MSSFFSSISRRVLVSAFLLSLFTVFAWGAKTEVGFPASRYFSSSEFRGHSQVFQTVQDSNGIVYLTNFSAVLAYDGERWTRIPVPDTTFLYGLALLEDDRIAVCGVGLIGLLEHDGKGGRVFRSLLEEVPESYRDLVGEMWDVYATEQGLFFFAQRAMLRWRDGDMKVWPFETERVIYGHWTGSEILIQNVGHGLYRLDGDEIEIVSDAPLFQVPGPRMIIDWEEDSKLVVTMREGLWVLFDSGLEHMPTDADEVLAEGVFNRGVQLPDGRLALGTFSQGVAVIEPDGTFVQHLTEGNGLPNRAITHLSLDRELGLWCSLATGVARVEMSGGISYYDLRNGLPSVVVTQIRRFKDVVYLSSGQGLFRLTPVELPHQPQWERVEAVRGEMFDLIEHDDSLFAAVEGRVMRVTDSEVEKVWDGNDLIRAVAPSKRDSNRIYVGTRLGLGFAAKIEGEWKMGELVADNNIYVQSIVETDDGDVWVGTQRDGVWRYRSEGTGLDWAAEASKEQFHTEAGLPDRVPLVVRLTEAGELRLDSIRGSFTWNEASGTFVPEADSPDKPPIEGWQWDVVVRHEPTDTAWGSLYPLEGADDDFNLYFARETTNESGEKEVTWLPSRIFEPIEGLNYEYIEGEEQVNLWAGGWKGLLRWEVSKVPDGVLGHSIQVLIRRVTLAGNEAVDWRKNGSQLPEFEHQSGALKFEYAAPVMSSMLTVEYRTKLEGFEEDWTEWSIESSREFTNLPEDDYRFLVEARTTLGETQQAASWGFVVRPPWFRSLWAYSLYVLGLALLVWMFVRLRLESAKRENLRLEELVSARTVDLQRSEADLRLARDEAERANKAKSQFLANMSHELRTPLNGILGYAQVLSRDTELTPRNKERVAIVESSGKHLLKLINEVLDLSKIEAGRMEVKLAPVSLAGLMRTASGVFHQRIDEKGLEFSVTKGPSLPATVMLDEQKVGQVLFNFLGNALKFTHQGRIELRIARGSSQGRLRFSVSDTGGGIPKEEQEGIFQPFRQLDHGKIAEPGTGLGLAISSKLVEAMGGAIGIESEVGQGSTFWFEVPLVESESHASNSELSRENERTRCATPGLRILVVDDVAVNRGVIREMLEPLGFVVEEADGGGVALEMIRRNRPDLMLLDMRMEPMDGAETIRRVREGEGEERLPVLAFSASALGFTREDARALGCDDFITKPFEWDELLDRLTDMLQVEWETGPDTGSTGGADSLGLRFSEEDLESLRTMANRGEPAGLKKKLLEIQARDQSLEPLVQEFLQLVNKFRIREVSERLDRMEEGE